MRTTKARTSLCPGVGVRYTYDEIVDIFGGLGSSQDWTIFLLLFLLFIYFLICLLFIYYIYLFILFYFYIFFLGGGGGHF